jgi:hypothetical protein
VFSFSNDNPYRIEFFVMRSKVFDRLMWQHNCRSKKKKDHHYPMSKIKFKKQRVFLRLYF